MEGQFYTQSDWNFFVRPFEPAPKDEFTSIGTTVNTLSKNLPYETYYENNEKLIINFTDTKTFNNNTKYIYFRSTNDNKNHDGIICAGFNLIEDRKVKFAFSFCSPKDKFDKTIARQIIDKRLNDYSIVVIEYVPYYMGNICYTNIAKFIAYYWNNGYWKQSTTAYGNIVENTLFCNLVPTWAYDKKLELKNND